MNKTLVEELRNLGVLRHHVMMGRGGTWAEVEEARTEVRKRLARELPGLELYWFGNTYGLIVSEPQDQGVGVSTLSEDSCEGA